jgi:hypothetical protein
MRASSSSSSDRRLSSRDAAIAIGLAVAVVASRLPFRGRILYHWDSINFARALDHFDIAAGQPHVPGYILYVALGRVVRLLIPDPQAALVAVSIAGSALAVAALYGLGRVMFSRPVGFAAALYLASSPLFWFYGEIALPHCLDAFMAIGGVWLLYTVAKGGDGALIPAALWLALAGGLRQQTQIFLLPLAFYAVWRGGRRPRLVTACVVWLAANCAWLVPLLWLTGGYSRYTEISREFTARFMAPTALFSGGLGGLRRNLIKLGMYTAYAWSAALLPLLGSLAPLRRAGVPDIARRWWSDSRTHVLALWMVPSLAVYTLIHMGQQGLVFFFLPACLLLAALATMAIAAQPVRRWMLAAAVALNASVFLFAPTFPLGGERPKLLTADTLRRHDAGYRARIDAVTRHFSPAHALILSSQWRFPEYYLPAYGLIRYNLGARWEVGEGRPQVGEESRIDPSTMTVTPDGEGLISVIVLDDELHPLNRSSDRLRWLALGEGERLALLPLRPGEQVLLGREGFSVTPGIATP